MGNFFKNKIIMLFVSMMIVCNLGYGQTLNIQGDLVFIHCADADLTINAIPNTGMDCTFDENSYQWQESDDMEDWDDISGAEETTLTIDANNIDVNIDGIYYQLTVTATCDGEEVGITSQTVFVQFFENIPPLTGINIDPNNEILCLGEEYELTAQPSHSTDGDYLMWFDEDPTNNPNAEPIAIGNSYDATTAGTYYAQRIGCTTDAVVNISVEFNTPSTPIDSITSSLTPDIPIACPGQNIILTASMTGIEGDNFSVEWYDDDDATNNLGSGYELSIVANNTEDYFVRREDACGETEFMSINIIVATTPTMPTEVEANEEMICAGDEDGVVLTASGGAGTNAQIAWYNSLNASEPIDLGTEAIVFPTETTTYYVRREDNCGNTTELNSITIEVIPLPTIVFTEAPSSVCIDAPVNYGITNPSMGIEWDFDGGEALSDEGAGPHEVVFDEVGNFEVTVIVTENGCSSTLTQEVVVSDGFIFNINETPSNTFTNIEGASGFPTEVIFDADLPDVTYTWDCTLISGRVDNIPVNGTGNLLETWTLEETDELDEALINCQVIAENEVCMEEANFEIRLKEILFVPDILTANGDNMNDNWDIACAEARDIDSGDFTIKLFDQNGKCVKGCDDIFTVSEAKDWDGTDCPAGAYFYLIEDGGDFQRRGALTILHH